MTKAEKYTVRPPANEKERALLRMAEIEVALKDIAASWRNRGFNESLDRLVLTITQMHMCATCGRPRREHSVSDPSQCPKFNRAT